jgi:hypothetical protein
MSRKRRGGETKIFKRHSIQLFLYEGPLVNKTELIEHIAKHADISKAAAPARWSP